LTLGQALGFFPRACQLSKKSSALSTSEAQTTGPIDGLFNEERPAVGKAKKEWF